MESLSESVARLASDTLASAPTRVERTRLGTGSRVIWLRPHHRISPSHLPSIFAGGRWLTWLEQKRQALHALSPSGPRPVFSRDEVRWFAGRGVTLIGVRM